MHKACFKKKMKSKSMTLKQKNSCCLCRRKIPLQGSKECVENLRHHVQKGKGWSMATLAEKYRQGTGVDQSWEQAAHFYKMGVEHGDVSSMVGLGLIYISGQGVEQDIEKAKELWMKAAKLGDITAILFLKKLDKQRVQ